MLSATYEPFMLSVIMLNCRNAERRYVECRGTKSIK
jgi:hypothetical protein